MTGEVIKFCYRRSVETLLMLFVKFVVCNLWFVCDTVVLHCLMDCM